MIYALWLGLLFLALVILVTGRVTEERPLLFVALFFLFLLGVVLLTGNLEYETGLNITENNSTSTTVTYSYADFTGTNAHAFGFFLSFVAGAGMWLVFVDWRRLKG